jgi:peptide/nickel transport system substrate-binding protein
MTATFRWPALRGALIAVAASAVALTALPAAAQKKGGDVIIAQSSNPPSLDGMVTSSQASRNITMHIYETLFGFSEKITPIPILAESVNISADGLTYRIPLRKGVKFHNGKEMTAKDVKASLERYRKYGATGNLLTPVKSIDITGDYEVTFRFDKATPTFLEAFASPRAPAVIIPEEEAGKEPGKINFIGTGPYRYVEYLPDRHVKLARFDGYVQDMRHPGPDGFGGKKTAYFDTITFRVMPEAGATVAALEAGEIHVAEQIPTPTSRRLKGNANVTVHENLPWAFLTFILNLKQPPANNPKFREAVQVALKMDQIVGIATEGLFRINHGWSYPGTTYDVGDVGKDLYNLGDADRAKKLLAEAGYKGEPFSVLTDSNIPEHNKAAVVIAEQLKKAGINAVINQVDWPTALKIRLQDSGWNGWTLAMGIEPYLGPVAIVSTLVGKATHFREADPALDKLYEELIAGKTEAERKATFTKIQTRLYELKAIIKLGDTGIAQATRANVKGFKPFRFPRLHDVWFQ